ncbi:MAG: hypothetical protein NC903_01635, partial [Candidatus Omnitrophica bacterium]|nr:hypothetical protein [Candidatus Omnitrophota bacterium]
MKDIFDFKLISKKNLTLKFILLFLLSAVALSCSVSFIVTPFNPEECCCDHLFYRSMAFNLFKVERPEYNVIPKENPLKDLYKTEYFSRYFDFRNALNRQPPYVYRILSPFIARAIGWLFFGDDISTGFYTLTFISIIFTIFFIGITLYLLNDSILLSFLGQIFCLLLWIFRFLLYDYMLTDPLNFLFISLTLFFMLKDKKPLIYLIFLLGLFNKEVFGFIIISYLLFRFLQKELKISEIFIISFIIIVYLLFRTFMPVPVNKFTFKNIFWGMNFYRIVSIYLNSFGILFFFTLTRMWFSSFTISLLPLGLGGIFTTIFASDHQRIIEYTNFNLVIFSVLGIKLKNK